MAHWDVFHSDRLEAERSVTTEAVLAALASGDLVEDDLVRPAGESRWSRIADAPEFAHPGQAAPAPAPDPDAAPSTAEFADDDAAEGDIDPLASDPDPDSDDEAEAEAEPGFDPRPTARQASSVTALPVLPDEEAEAPDLPELDGPEDEFDPQDEDDEAAEFTLSRNSPETVEELDLAAMVDVAFQLVLFFLVTASTVVFKTLEVPRPNEDKPPEAAAQARSKSIDELEKDYILVEVDAGGSVKVDRQPIKPDRAALAERLRSAREATGRKAMLLSADFATRHENAVLVFDVASEIDLQIAIAQPAGKK